VIHEVDDALAVLVRREALNGSDVDVVFDAPTKDWASRRNAPTVNLYLYDIREDLRLRTYGSVDVVDPDGHTGGRAAPPRYFKLSYLVTAWTQRPQDEHRLLSNLLSCFLRFPVLPVDVLPPGLRAAGGPVWVTIALPPPEDRALSDVWSALGGELKPSLDLVALVAIDAVGERPVAALVIEPRLRVTSPQVVEEVSRRVVPARRG
jgi:hypothetical protein